MIDNLEIALQRLIEQEALGGSDLASAKISFGAPDKTWRDSGSGLELNIYLYELVENTELRSNERRLLRNIDGTATVELPVKRVDCKFIITAWNKSMPVLGTDRERQEHRLLAQVLYVLWRNPTLAQKYQPPALRASQESEIPLAIVEARHCGSTPEFWSGIGSYVRPAIGCLATVGIGLDAAITDSVVTGLAARLSGGEEMHIIGGTIYDSASPRQPVPNAWVLLQGAAGSQLVMTKGDGRYVLEWLWPGSYTLLVRAVGFKDGRLAITVPRTSGSYDVALTSL